MQKLKATLLLFVSFNVAALTMKKTMMDTRVSGGLLTGLWASKS